MDDKITQEPIEGQSVLPGFEAASQVEEEPHAQEVEEEQLAPIYDPVQPFYTQRDRDSITHLQYNVAAIQAEAHVYVDRANEATKKGEKELSKMLMKEWRKRITDADASRPLYLCSVNEPLWFFLYFSKALSSYKYSSSPFAGIALYNGGMAIYTCPS